jgi:uncharacterized protein
VHLDGSIVLAGAIVGFAVGLTGMGGGALMTPVLVLFLHVQPAAAVSSDLVASVFMKPVGSAVHLRRRTVHLQLAKWLCVGAVPAAFAGASFLHLFADGKSLENVVKWALGSALLVAVVGLAARALTSSSQAPPSSETFPAVRVVPTIVVGVVGGFIVGMTSVGSGSLMIVALMFLYPTLTGGQLVGTDLVQSVPLVGAAALGQLIFGNVQFGLTTSLLLGSIPAVYVGAKLSSLAPTGLLRAAIGVMLLLSGLKLVEVSNTVLAASGAAALVVVLGTRAVRSRRRTPDPHELHPQEVAV